MEQEWNGNGMGMEGNGTGMEMGMVRERNVNGKGMELEGNGNGTGLVRERVVLYAAGKFGRAVYQKLVATGHQVVLWLDQAPQMAQADGLPVEGPSALQRLAPADWDDLVIAVLHEAAVPVIRETLATLDVDMEQVHWFDMRQYSFCR